MKKERETRIHVVCWMIRKDMPAVLRIEETSHDYPWCEEDFLRCLRQRTCIGMIVGEAQTTEKVFVKYVEEANGDRMRVYRNLEYENKIPSRTVGFMIYELCERKLHLLNFAVHPERRRCGVGAQMVEKLASKLSVHRRPRIIVEVRETNLDAQLFFRSVGFRATGVSREFFDDSGEDAYVMEYRLGRTPREFVTASTQADED